MDGARSTAKTITRACVRERQNMVTGAKNPTSSKHPHHSALASRKTQAQTHPYRCQPRKRLYRARYYHAELGRFLSRDPVGYLDGANLYRGYFVPNRIDPFGRQRQGPPGFGGSPVGGWPAGTGPNPPDPWHPDNKPPISRDSDDNDPRPYCPAMEDGCMRHCIASCRLKLHIPLGPVGGVVTEGIAQTAGNDLPWDGRRKELDVYYNQLGINCAKQGKSNSCISCCQRKCEGVRLMLCCRSNFSLNKTDPKCNDLSGPRNSLCRNPIQSLCYGMCKRKFPGVAEDNFQFKFCYEGCVWELSGLGNNNPFDDIISGSQR